MLYTPRVNPLPYEKLFNREHQRWLQIEKMYQVNSNNMVNEQNNADFYRTPLMTKLICTYIDLLKAKVALVKEFGNIVNSAYVLQPNTIGENHQSNNSPIAKNFVIRVT